MDLLRKAGADVLGPAAMLADALAFAGPAVLGCAVLDVNLRHELVFPAAQRLRGCGVPIVFHPSHSERERLRRDWPDAVALTKPAPQKRLIRAVCETFRGVGFCAGKGRGHCS
jgi:hypothetical protein